MGMTLTGYTPDTFRAPEQIAFCKVMSQRVGVSPDSCTVTSVTASTRRLLASVKVADATFSRYLASDGGINVAYAITLTQVNEVLSAQLVFEKLRDLTDGLNNDPAIRESLVQSLIAAGVTGDSPTNSLGVTGAIAPTSSHASPVWNKPTFGKGKDPLPDVSPPEDTTDAPITASGLSPGEIAAIVIGSTVFAAILVGLVWFRKHKRNEASKVGVSTPGTAAPVAWGGPQAGGISDVV